MRVPSFTPNHVCCFGEYILHQLWQVFNINPALYCWELLGFLLKMLLVASSCGRFQCGPVGVLRRVDGSSLLFTEFTTVLCAAVSFANLLSMLVYFFSNCKLTVLWMLSTTNFLVYYFQCKYVVNYRSSISESILIVSGNFCDIWFNFFQNYMCQNFVSCIS